MDKEPLQLCRDAQGQRVSCEPGLKDGRGCACRQHGRALQAEQGETGLQGRKKSSWPERCRSNKVGGRGSLMCRPWSHKGLEFYSKHHGKCWKKLVA